MYFVFDISGQKVAAMIYKFQPTEVCAAAVLYVNFTPKTTILVSCY